jgi:hypothetical protein
MMIDVKDAAALTGVKPDSARNYTFNGVLPLPDTTDDRGRPLWRVRTIWRWAEAYAYGMERK